MQRLLRNGEVARSLGIFLAICLIGIVIGWLRGWEDGVLVSCLCAALLLVHFITLWRRYRRIAALSADLDRILHGDDTLKLESFAEGELGVLQSEISKMLIRLRETADSLHHERSRLADSLADISHQLRTPLTSIHLLLTMLSDPQLTEEHRLSLMQELHTLVSRLDWLVTSLLKLSKLDAGTVQLRRDTIPLRTLLEHAGMSVQLPMELREQTLTIQAEGNFCGDDAWTAEALGNILKNCMEHTPQGGCISVTAAENPLYAEIIITDTGSGILPEDLPHIFERFYKGKSSGENGFGIGLALARTIITAQNGTVKAENRPGGGSRFVVRFYRGAV